MTKTGIIKITAIISAILMLFIALTILAGQKYIQSPFFETVYIYAKFAILIASDLFIHFSRLIFDLVFSSWKVFAALLLLFAIVVIRWLFGYHAD